MSPQRQEQYYNLIDELLRCANGEEPDVLNANAELIDTGLVQALVQVGTMMAHENNPDGAKFLFHVARELAQQLGLYPQTATAK
ncbi:conserved hypothetical protein [Gloeothece citriformis PCC 7424]|uniref:Uncharacterized protein n=1 Tax=Gloeothece citriformis (strain PCC 7424) TaxID=65393 RepID=B7KG58_GLOC7|nr:hypothetical protein [Gloeothece citriformis]ACK70529.1 conserved hypothetical protein [Gloeothece citriformis PCC 7424]